jgi:cell division GTPase FtsZ
MQADAGMEELKKYVDSFLVISNDRLTPDIWQPNHEFGFWHRPMIF